jgi:hypothetical protein
MDFDVDVVRGAEAGGIFATDRDEIVEARVHEFDGKERDVLLAQGIFDIAAGHAWFDFIGVRAKNGLILDVAETSEVTLPEMVRSPSECDDEESDEDVSWSH